MKNKRGFELALSTIVLMVISILLLVGMVVFLTMNWERFSETIKGYLGSEEQRARDLCESQCSLQQEYDFCCAEKEVRDAKMNCSSLGVECSEIECLNAGCS